MAGGRSITRESRRPLIFVYSPFLQNNDDAKVILANAVQHCEQSVKIWLAASDLEHDIKAKKRVLRKGASIRLLDSVGVAHCTCSSRTYS